MSALSAPIGHSQGTAQGTRDVAAFTSRPAASLLGAAIVALSLLASASALAADCASAEKSPARYGQSDRALHKLLRMPGKAPDGDFRVALHCNFMVSKRGRAREAGCKMDTTSDVKSAPFMDAFVKAAGKARFIPARVDGKPKVALMQVTAVYQRKEGKSQIYALPNIGWNAESYGAMYIAPQYLLGSNDIDGGTDYSYSNTYQPKRLTIAADGTISDWQLLTKARKARSKADDFKRWSRQACFVPGLTADGAQEMTFQVLTLPKTIRWQF